jgi:hypothetical protein
MRRRRLVRNFIVDHPFTALLLVAAMLTIGYVGYGLAMAVLSVMEMR